METTHRVKKLAKFREIIPPADVDHPHGHRVLGIVDRLTFKRVTMEPAPATVLVELCNLLIIQSPWQQNLINLLFPYQPRRENHLKRIVPHQSIPQGKGSPIFHKMRPN